MREARWSNDTPREDRRMIRGFHHVAVTTPDLERFIDHYERWCGFERVAEGGWEPDNERVGRMVQLPGSSARYAMIRLGSFYMEVFQYHQPEGVRIERRMCDPGLIHICLYVDDAQAEYERLRSEEHTSELQSLMRISYAVFCLKTKKYIKKKNTHIQDVT